MVTGCTGRSVLFNARAFCKADAARTRQQSVVAHWRALLCKRVFQTHNARQAHRIHAHSPRALENPRTRRQRRAGGHHIIHHQHTLPGQARPRALRHLERPRHIAPAALAAEAALARRVAATHQDIRIHRAARLSAEGLSEQRRLIEQALAQPFGVQGHGDDEIGLPQAIACGRRHPARKAVEPVGASAMLERQDHGPTGFIIQQRRDGAVEIRRPRNTGRTPRVRAIIGRERCAASRAPGRCEERQARPGLGAQPAGRVHGRIAQ